MKVLVIGGAGQLGQDVLDAFCGHEVHAPSHAELDIASPRSITTFLGALKPEVVVNTAAFHDLPKCELEPHNAFSVNATGVRNLAHACRDIDARLVHISTDCVFDGAKGAPYDEDDAPRPLMVYGASKLAGEHLALSQHERTWVVRTTGLFGFNPCRAKGGRNFVESMLHFAATQPEVRVIGDQRCCPTYTVDLAKQLLALVDSDAAPGVYHAVNSAGCTWYEFAQMVFGIAETKVRLAEISAADYPASFKRPADSRLACTKLEQAGICCMRPLETALAEFLRLRS